MASRDECVSSWAVILNDTQPQTLALLQRGPFSQRHQNE